ncbi:MAG: tetratricopeptide repeat protein [bacterium]
MLYNVLPPLVFFASLGGTIYVVSRVVTRLHRQNLAAAVRTTSTRDFAVLLGPSQKSVHVIKNRLSVAGHSLQQLLLQIKEKIAALRNLPTIKPPTKYLAKIRRTLNKAKEKAGQVKISQKITSKETRPVLRMIEKPVSAKPVSSPPVSLTPSAKPTLAKKIFFKKPKATSLDTARQQLSACRYQSAEKTLVPFLAKHPRNTHAYMLLGKAALGRHNWSEASEVFEQVVSLKPNTKGCYAALGYANYKAGRLTKAMEALKKAHDADPSNVVIIKRLLSIARRMDNLPLQHSLTAQLAELKTSARQ